MRVEALSVMETGSSGGLATVKVMQSAQQQQRDNVAMVWRFDRARLRTILT